MTRRETAIFKLWDAGHSSARIARSLGVEQSTVASKISQLEGADEERLHRKAMMASNNRFLAALQQGAT